MQVIDTNLATDIICDYFDAICDTDYAFDETEILRRMNARSVDLKRSCMTWIPVSERLPKQGQEVICQCRANIIKVLKLDANGDWHQDAEHCYMGGFVIAWVPLPEPYSEKL